MGYDLSARKKGVEGFHMGAFSWSWMLNKGVGWVIGTGEGYAPAQYVFTERPDGLQVNCNDGARVTAKESKDMAKVARWLAAYERCKRNCWNREPEEKRKEMMDDPHRLYKPPVREDFVEKVEAFADWAEKSGGFTIH